MPTLGSPHAAPAEMQTSEARLAKHSKNRNNQGSNSNHSSNSINSHLRINPKPSSSQNKPNMQAPEERVAPYSMPQLVTTFKPTSNTPNSRKLIWKPKKGPTETTVLLKGGYMGFHVNLGECSPCEPWTKFVVYPFISPPKPYIVPYRSPPT